MCCLCDMRGHLILAIYLWDEIRQYSHSVLFDSIKNGCWLWRQRMRKGLWLYVIRLQIAITVTPTAYTHLQMSKLYLSFSAVLHRLRLFSRAFALHNFVAFLMQMRSDYPETGPRDPPRFRRIGLLEFTRSLKK